MAQTVKHLPTMQESQVLSLGHEDPWKRKWQPTTVLLPGKFHGQRSLVRYSPWGRKELDMTERLHLSHFSHVQLFVTLLTMPPQAPLSMRFSRQEYWSELPCSLPGDFPDPGIEPRSPALQADALPSEPPEKPIYL